MNQIFIVQHIWIRISRNKNGNENQNEWKLLDSSDSKDDRSLELNKCFLKHEYDYKSEALGP